MAPPVSVFANDKLMSYVTDTVNSTSFQSMQFFDGTKVKAMLRQLPQMSARDRTAAEPVLMMMLTSHILQQRFGLAA
jgi:asparagine synthase (glutamine-hydrolysing)